MNKETAVVLDDDSRAGTYIRSHSDVETAASQSELNDLIKDAVANGVDVVLVPREMLELLVKGAEVSAMMFNDVVESTDQVSRDFVGHLIDDGLAERVETEHGFYCELTDDFCEAVMFATDLVEGPDTGPRETGFEPEKEPDSS